jgi:hypothetical protein
MRDRPAAREMRFRATQTIDLQRLEFDWQASTGPFGCISVRDALRDGQAHLEVHLFRGLRFASIRGSDALSKGEIMRYLAELAWAPDAILLNPWLTWTIIDGRTLRVSTGLGNVRGEVELRLDESGLIARVSAQDRPHKEGSGFVERPWHGRFFDYRKYQHRWLPFAAEVGWILDGQTFISWRGEVLNWRAS